MMVASILTVACCLGRRLNRFLSTLPNDHRMVESSFLKKGRNINNDENRGGLRGWIDRRYQVTPLFEFLRHKEVPLGSHWMGWYYPRRRNDVLFHRPGNHGSA